MNKKIAKLKAKNERASETNERLVQKNQEMERKLTAVEADKEAERQKNIMNNKTRKALKFIFEMPREVEIVTLQEIAKHMECSDKEARQEVDKLVVARFVSSIAIPVESRLGLFSDKKGYRITNEGWVYAKRGQKGVSPKD